MPNNAVSFDIMTYFNDQGFGTTGVDLFAMTWGINSGSEVDKQILITDNEQQSGQIKELYEMVGFQVLCRGSKFESPNIVYNRLRGIHEFLINRQNEEINQTCYLEFEVQTAPISLGEDENGRYIASANYYSFRNSIK